VKEGDEGEANASAFKVDAIAEIQPFYANKSRKGRSKKKADSTPKPAMSKQSKFPSVVCFWGDFNLTVKRNIVYCKL
jgi:hypothetical protein